MPEPTTGFLDPLSSWPSPPPPGYLGQLDPAFQERRSQLYADVGRGECDWYHSTDLPDGSFAQGEWDLRGTEQPYLGNLPIASQRVLEIGPASGYLTFWMERAGADVTAFEAGYDAGIELVPGTDEHEAALMQQEIMRHTQRTTNAWWFLHRMTGSSARLVHGDLYSLPADLGRYDFSFLGCVLVHTRDPYTVLSQVAGHTDTIVVTEQHDPSVPEGCLQFNPDLANIGPSVMWWRFSPGALVTMLWRLGFTSSSVSFSSQRHHLWSVQEGLLAELPMFTVVARRQPQVTGDQARASLLAGLQASQVRGPGACGISRAGPQQDGVAELTLRIAELTAERDACSGEVETLRQTRTFRWTAPARRIYQQARTIRDASQRRP